MSIEQTLTQLAEELDAIPQNLEARQQRDELFALFDRVEAIETEPDAKLMHRQADVMEAIIGRVKALHIEPANVREVYLEACRNALSPAPA